MEFKNQDVIITDPCYVVSNDDDWEKCNYGMSMGSLGFKQCITASTIYGDWSCDTMKLKTNEVIGSFTADAGMVGVFNLDEVLKYNPDFKDFMEVSPWCVTVIKNFTGDIQILENNYDQVYVYGLGSTNFYTAQK